MNARDYKKHEEKSATKRYQKVWAEVKNDKNEIQQE